MKVPRELVTVIRELDEIMSLSNREDFIKAMIFKPGDLPVRLYMNLIQCHE